MNAAELEEVIRDAFAGVTLGDGVSIRQCQVRGKYGAGATLEEYEALPLQEITDNWMEVEIEQVPDLSDLAHLDEKGFRYYLPALMCSALHGHADTVRDVTFALDPPRGDLWTYYMMHYSLLNARQRRAVALFLHSLPELIDLDEENEKDAARALRSFWGQYLPVEE